MSNPEQPPFPTHAGWAAGGGGGTGAAAGPNAMNMVGSAAFTSGQLAAGGDTAGRITSFMVRGGEGHQSGDGAPGGSAQRFGRFTASGSGTAAGGSAGTVSERDGGRQSGEGAAGCSAPSFVLSATGGAVAGGRNARTMATGGGGHLLGNGAACGGALFFGHFAVGGGATGRNATSAAGGGGGHQAGDGAAGGDVFTSGHIAAGDAVAVSRPPHKSKRPYFMWDTTWRVEGSGHESTTTGLTLPPVVAIRVRANEFFGIS